MVCIQWDAYYWFKWSYKGVQCVNCGFFFSLVQSESVQTADNHRVGQQVHLPGAQGPELGEGEARAGQQLHAQVQELLPGETGTPHRLYCFCSFIIIWGHQFLIVFEKYVDLRFRKFHGNDKTEPTHCFHIFYFFEVKVIWKWIA